MVASMVAFIVHDEQDNTSVIPVVSSNKDCHTKYYDWKNFDGGAAVLYMQRQNPRLTRLAFT